jgi:hypothetical protein
MPGFIHEIGSLGHHWSMMRTADRDGEGEIIPFTGPSNWRWVVHEFLDDWIFYPIKFRFKKWLGEGRIYERLSTILGFFWGLNCGFPPRDVARYTVWSFRGCKPLAVFRKRGETWVKTYPSKTEGIKENVS